MSLTSASPRLARLTRRVPAGPPGPLLSSQPGNPSGPGSATAAPRGPVAGQQPIPGSTLDGQPAGPSRLVVRASLALTLLATAALYIVGLSASGYANSFYSAAAQAGSTSWKAWFYGSLDGANSITVDKPPAALWIMSLSVRIFGLSSWSILVPEALMGVASVGVLYATVRRSLAGTRDGGIALTHTAHWAALAGAATLALTPSAALMFRFNNPDALLVLLEVAASWCVVRAAQTASRKHLVLGGVLVGFGFLTKMLQAFLVLPAFVVAYAVAAPATWRRKVTDLLAAFAAVVVSFGWYVAVVELVPASWRPYIGGSQTNSLLELAFGYNGLGRITGNETGGLGNGGSSSGAGVFRIFESVSGGMISWLVPAAILLAGFAWAVLGRHAWANLNAGKDSVAIPKTVANAGLLTWFGSLLVTAAVFSSMSGIYHDYYTVALAPGIAGTVAIAAGILWARRDSLVARTGLALATCATGVWAVRLLMRAGGTWTVFGGFIAVGATLAALGLLFADRLPDVVARTALALAVVSSLAGPAAYSVNTAQTAHTGSIVTAGPVSGGMGGGMRGGTGGAPGGMRGGAPTGGQPPTGTAPGQTGTGTGTATGTSNTGTAPGGTARGGGMSVLNGATVSTAMKSLLTANSSQYTWTAATVGAQGAASYQLATGTPVMAVGGFNGTDPSPTLAEFKALVAQGKIHYFIGSGSTGMGGNASSGSDAASEIASWVGSTYTAQTVDGVTVYDLTAS